MIKRTFEKENVLTFGPYSEEMYNALEKMKEQDLTTYFAALYIAHDNMQSQLRNMERHPNIDKSDLHQLQKVAFTFSIALQREVYGRKNSDAFSIILDNESITTKFAAFQNTYAKFKSNFYFYKNTDLKHWVVVKDQLEIMVANKVVKKINERKAKKDLQSINPTGFNFTRTIKYLQESLLEEDQKLGRIMLSDPTRAIKFKTARTNNLKWNNIGNIRKDIRETITHEDGKVIEIDMVAAYPSIMPIFIIEFLKKKSKTHSSMINQYNHFNHENFKIDQELLYSELKDFINHTNFDIYMFFLKESGLDIQRNIMKKDFLHFLFDNQEVKYQRSGIIKSVVITFKKHFPNLYNTILSIKHDIGYKNFSIYIQNITSKIMKDTIKKFQKVDRSIPFLPICDCFYVPENKKDIVVQALKDVLKENGLEHINLKEKTIGEGSVVPPSQLTSLVLDNNEGEKNDPTNFPLLTSLHGFFQGGKAPSDTLGLNKTEEAIIKAWHARSRALTKAKYGSKEKVLQ